MGIVGAVGIVGVVGAVGAVRIVGAVGYKLAPEGEMRVQATSSHQRGRAFAKRPYITYYKSC